MKYRNLRIAWSVVWGVAAVLLVVLWVRSYWWADLLGYRIGQTYVAAGSGRGIAFFRWTTFQPSVTVGNKVGWELSEGPTGTIDSSLKPLEWSLDTNPAAAFGFFISVPCWFCVACSAALSFVALNRYRFSLRTLLIATTLVAIMLGLIVWLR
jgi:hypothetical protein